MKRYYNDPETTEQIKDSKPDLKRKEALNAGLHITDENGILLPEYY